MHWMASKQKLSMKKLIGCLPKIRANTKDTFCIISNSASYQNIRVGGAETSLLQTATQLIKKGHPVLYITFYDLPLRHKLFNKIEYLGIKTFSIDNTFLKKFLHKVRMNWLYRYIQAFILTLLLKLHRVNIIYTYYEPNVLDLLHLCKTKFGINSYHIMRMAGIFWYEDIKKNTSRLRLYTNWFKTVNCVNYIHANLKNFAKEKAKEIGLHLKFKDELIWDIGSDALKIVKNHKRQKYFQNRSIRLVSATRITKYAKRQDILLHALSKCIGHINFELLLIGEGNNKEYISSLIYDLNLSDHVKVVPFMGQDELWNCILSYDLFCHPTNYEGLGKIVIECLSIGVPVLTSKVPVLDKLIDNNITGFLVDNNPDAWADIIINLSKNRQLLNQVSQNAKKLFSSNIYKPESQINKFLEYIHNIQI